MDHAAPLTYTKQQVTGSVHIFGHPQGCHGDNTSLGRGLESQVRLEPVCRTPIVGAARTVLSEVFGAGVMSGGGAGEGHEA